MNNMYMFIWAQIYVYIYIYMIWYDMVRYWCQRLFVNSMKGKQTLRARGGLLEDVHKKSDGYNDGFQ